MKKLYFFQKRNPRDGTLMDTIIDASDHDGHLYMTQPRHFKYIGWSDGRFIKAYKNKLRMPTDKDAGNTPVSLDEETKTSLQEAIDKELEFAKNNKDKTPPRDMSAVNINGGPLDDPYLANALKRRNG